VERKSRAAIEEKNRETAVKAIDNRAPEQGPMVDAGERLRRSIDVVCENAALVELWACALNGFAQPLPDYGPPMGTGRESRPKEG